MWEDKIGHWTHRAGVAIEHPMVQKVATCPCMIWDAERCNLMKRNVNIGGMEQRHILAIHRPKGR